MINDESFSYKKDEANNMDIHKFENSTEVLEICCLNDNNDDYKIKELNSLSYQLKNKKNKPFIEIVFAKQKEDTYVLVTTLYPESLTEQKKFFDIIKYGKEVDEIYNMYYTLGNYVENSKSISVETIEDIVGQKSENIEFDTKDGITTSYNIEKSKNRLTILYNKKEEQIYFTSVENNNTSTHEISLYCSEDDIEKESKMIVVVNKDLKEQQKMIKDIILNKE